MSQRALKKRELSLQRQEKENVCQIYRKQPSAQQKSKYIQRNSAINKNSTSNVIQTESGKSKFGYCKRKFCSTPNLTLSPSISNRKLNRSQSESDLSCLPEANNLVNAKSEFHLQSIASSQVSSHNLHTTRDQIDSGKKRTEQTTRNKLLAKKQSQSEQQSRFMSSDIGFMSSQTSSSSSTSSNSENIRIPIVGFEVMEERARFTVYKLRVENPGTNDCWMILRRYTDFQRLNNKLKSMFPQLSPLSLPKKKLFGDNFSTLFLNARVQGLQQFIDAIMTKDILRNSQPVRDFFCLDEPPTYSENIFEAQEETIAHLKSQLRAKEETINALQQQLKSESEKSTALSTLKFE